MTLKKYFDSNKENFLILLILFSVPLIHYFIQFKVSLLKFYYIPIMLAGYLLGRRLAVLYAFFTVLLVWVFILANKEAYEAIQNQFELKIDLTLWGGFLILSGWAGSLSENLRTELNNVTQLKIELERDRENLRITNEKLNEANRKLEDKISERTQELERSQAELIKTSQTDPLTTLFNRRAGEEKVTHEIFRFNRSRLTFCILMCDIDHFKRVNDSLGNSAGDFVLRRLAAILKESMRITDVVFRWGGKKFLILLPDTKLHGGIIAGENIRKKVEKEIFTFDQNNSSLTVSLGISEYKEGQSMDDCINSADNCLYLAKEKGRNRLHAPQ